MRLRDFLDEYGELYSGVLGINLGTHRNSQLVRWFLASILYSKPIRESSATRTYKCFEKHGILTVDKILKTRWDGLVAILDEGGYTRYDFSTADKLLEVFRNLRKVYKGSLNLLHHRAADSSDLERRLKALGKGIGPTTVSIFLRDKEYLAESKTGAKPSGAASYAETWHRKPRRIRKRNKPRCCTFGDGSSEVI